MAKRVYVCIYAYHQSGDTGNKGVACKLDITNWKWDGRYSTEELCDNVDINIVEYMGSYDICEELGNSKILVYEGYMFVEEDMKLCTIEELRGFEPHSELWYDRSTGIIVDFYTDETKTEIITSWGTTVSQVGTGWCWYKCAENVNVIVPESIYDQLPTADNIPPEEQTYSTSPVISTINDGSGDAWIWAFKMDNRDKSVNATDASTINCSTTFELNGTTADGQTISKILNTSTTLDDGVLLAVDDVYTLDCSITTGTDDEGRATIGMITFSGTVYRLPPGQYTLKIEIDIDNGWDGETNKYILTSNFTIPEKPTYENSIRVSADFTAKPNCVCYLNSETEKTVNFTFDIQNIKFEPPNVEGVEYTNVYYQDLIDNAKWIVRLYEKDSDTVLAEKELQYTTDTLDYTFTLPTDTKKDYEMKLFCNINGTEYEVGTENIIVERQEYCHSMNIEVKTYDLAGNELTTFPHPTSADYDESLHSEITVKIKIKDEQGNYIDVPVENIHTNWQYSITQIDIGQYEMKIPNDSTDALNIDNYGIAVYIDKAWTDLNGYYNKYNIEATDVYFNLDSLEKIGLWGFTGITSYENGITYLDAVYEYISGTFVNPQCNFSIVQQLNEDRELKQYSYCYRVYDSSMTLNVLNYTEDEMEELAKSIVRELGQPRKIETFTLLTKEIPKINNSITLNHNGQLLSMPVYSCHVSISKSNLQIKIKNDENKLLKDYLSLIK